jgi:effector-binding domain-containing protein
MDRQNGFLASLRVLAGRWKALLALAVVVAFAAIYLERKLFSASVPPIASASAQAQKQTPAAPPASGEALKPGGEATENEAPPEASTDMPPAESVSSQTVEVAARPVAALKGEAKWDDAPKALSDAIAKINAAVTKEGLTPSGRPLTVFTETNENNFHYEAMIPLAKAPEGKPKLADGVEIGSSPAGKALKFEHRGAYDEIDATYEAITAYLDEKGLDTKNVFIEEYLTDLKPEDESVADVDIYVFVK